LSGGRDTLDKLSQPVQAVPTGLDLFDPDDEALFRVIALREFSIGGMQNETLRRFPRDETAA
jgi:hypothetical protein